MRAHSVIICSRWMDDNNQRIFRLSHAQLESCEKQTNKAGRRLAKKAQGKQSSDKRVGVSGSFLT